MSVKAVLIFAWAVFNQWTTLVLALPGLIAVINLWRDKPFRATQRLLNAAAILLLVSACYRAWLQQFDKVGVLTLKVGDLTKQIDRLNRANSSLSSEVGDLQLNLATDRQRSQEVKARRTSVIRLAPVITQKSIGDNSPNTSIVGNQNQVTIVPAPPPRKIAATDLSTLQRQASLFPAAIQISYEMNDGEAFALAMQLRDALAAAGWKIDSMLPSTSFSEAGGPVYGVNIALKTDAKPGSQFRYLQASSIGVLGEFLQHEFPGDVSFTPDSGLPPDTLRLTVYSNPKLKPHS